MRITVSNARLARHFAAALVAVAAFAPTAQASLVSFDALPVESVTPALQVDGVTLNFDNLMTIAAGSTLHGFGGIAGTNRVQASDQASFSGNFLTASNYGLGQYRSHGFTRTISFSAAVSDVALYLADVDAGEGITVNLFNAANTLLESRYFTGTAANDSRAILADFAGMGGVRAMTLVGNDPIGLDNLSFTAAPAGALPVPGSAWLAVTALSAAWAARSRQARS